ncbi:methyl-accepting chemotaxis protein [uncultured Roseobacter sp.]|uniref:methyl-accepting chemotaxis protein n=1 Tax=uncultured Roseobacter sp. TaxID=114847 RepID=UPI00262EE9E2|nr:methyl-accepting chemotaxis protein [uncultured Roseobacter sp.]
MQRSLSVPSASTIDALPYRDAIDRVATTRALVVRIALNVSLLSGGAREADREELLSMLQAQTQKLRHTLEVLQGTSTFSDLPEELSLWLAHLAQDQNDHMRIIRRMADLTDTLTAAARSPDGASASNLQSYIALGQTEFFDAVTRLTDHVWAQVENGRSQQLEVAMQSATRLGEGLSRLERIGKYVRSMSINASVEASRAGEAGKGLAIIAQEFKVLAEEVQQLTLSAREDIESIEASH